MYHFEKKIQKIFFLEGPREMFGTPRECFPGPAVALDGPVVSLWHLFWLIRPQGPMWVRLWLSLQKKNSSDPEKYLDWSRLLNSRM